ncbi:uncharacterized protein LOC130648440 [Hydractinia symbiolongicarpus]|uniref:uncharacterized protein LOC130648440 n=1 Tax=Hydractinia symbiolongicarpus TaxID=13093 RepID=UPI00254AFCA0|nr:uncharacterized protein LOC130648440 [Hydractinia symbiolongicarpus]XP_057310482.1 uncharacterized protein LOC130648440 [Hydractinia symbiolongicarpus]
MKDEKLSWVSFQNLKDVPEDVVVKMIRHVGKKILDGKVYCERHEAYNLKGRKRACLAMEVSFGNFTDYLLHKFTQITQITFAQCIPNILIMWLKCSFQKQRHCFRVSLAPMLIRRC